MMKNQTCCFTGHRLIPPGQYRNIAGRLKNEIIKLINDGYYRFCAGGALGFDTLAAQVVLALRKEYPHIQLVLVLPCFEQTKNWKELNKKIYNQILDSADEIIYVSVNYNRYCMYKRDRYLVDSSNFCICYLKKPTGGAAYTVEYAKKNEVDVENLAE